VLDSVLGGPGFAFWGGGSVRFGSVSSGGVGFGLRYHAEEIP
jgi:hypothetical protein